MLFSISLLTIDGRLGTRYVMLIDTIRKRVLRSADGFAIHDLETRGKNLALSDWRDCYAINI
jgi:hypothetical protein